MKKEQKNESVEIELDVRTSFDGQLKIRAKKSTIYCQGDPSLKELYYDNREKTIPISQSDFNDLIEDIKAYRVCSIPEFTSGIDGTTYTISVENGMNSVVYRWWGECPKEWDKLGKLAEKLIDYVRQNNIQDQQLTQS